MAKNKKQSEDKFGAVNSALSKSEAFIERNSKPLIIALVVVVVIVLGIFALQRYYFQPRKIAAQEEMFKAQSFFSIDDYETALTGDGNYLGFLDIQSQYKGTQAAKLANYYIGISYLRLGEYDNSIKYLSKFKSKDFYVYAMSKAAIGDAYMELNNLNSAIKFYKEAAAIHKNENTTPEHLKKLAIAYELNGNNKEALNTYKKILADYPNTTLKNEVKRGIGKLENI
ncbi:MAG: tetratricopeptide repeat protein [Bacteroidales bacterium]|jgi:tetratricopeptide (TPR) repeat protein|nr:tetratricopeptide repeat protein [Bacteroidales bacterium]